MSDLDGILSTFNQRGWSVYQLGIRGTVDRIERTGPCTSLSDGRYAVLPAGLPVRKAVACKDFAYIKNESYLYDVSRFEVRNERIVLADGKKEYSFELKSFHDYLMNTLPKIRCMTNKKS